MTHTDRSPWPGLLSMIIGFFMILVDATIVKVHRHGQGARGGLKIRP